MFLLFCKYYGRFILGILINLYWQYKLFSADERYPVGRIRKELFQILRSFNIQSIKTLIITPLLPPAPNCNKESHK